MIKGHSYDNQLWYSVAHRLYNNTFLNGSNGIISGEGKSCALAYTSNTITIDNGFFIVQGGINEIEESETLNVSLDNSYCKLIYELDMSQTNTDTEFKQGKLKIITGTNAYPTLTQQKLTETTGVYQYEFAQFRALPAGISDFIDKRTFLDYTSIFEYIKEQIENIEDGSIYVLKTDAEKYFDKNNIAVVTGTMTVKASTDTNYVTSSSTANYPTGFTSSNCVCIAVGTKYDSAMGYCYGTLLNSAVAYNEGSQPTRVKLDNSNISISSQNMSGLEKTLYYRIVLLRIL